MNLDVPPIAGFVFALLVCAAMGPTMPWLLRLAAATPNPPPDIPENYWRPMIGAFRGGAFFGFLERLLFLISFWSGLEILVGAWLAFKLASKWEAWKNVVQVPPKLEGIDEFAWYIARKTYSSWLLTRFWAGTLINLAVAFMAAKAGLFVSHEIGGFFSSLSNG